MILSNCSSKFNYISKPKEISDNLKKKSHSFCLKICAFELPINISQNKSETYIVRASLFDVNLKRFIGKQWNSSKINKHNIVDDVIKLELNETFYFHTSQIDESLVVLFELIRYQSKDNEASVGWSIFNLFKADNKLVDISSSQHSETISIEIHKGTPRALLLMSDLPEKYPALQNYDKALIHLKLNINQSFDSCQNLVPENLLLHEDDKVPGLQTMPNGKHNLSNPITKTFVNYTIDKLKIVFEPSLHDFENNFKKLINSDHLLAENVNLDKNPESLVIIERRLRVGVHNGYIFVDDNETVCLNVKASKVNSAKSESVSNNTLTANSSIGVSLPEDCHFSVIFVLEYIVSQTPIEDAARQSNSLVTSSQHTYNIGWAIHKPFAEQIESKSLQDGIILEMKLSGGSDEAPEDVLVYRPETFNNIAASSDGDARQYCGNDMTLKAVFRTKIISEVEPVIDVKKNALAYSERALPSDKPDAEEGSTVDSIIPDKQVRASKSKIKNARNSQHQQLLTQQPSSDHDPNQMSSLLLGTVPPLTNEPMGSYKDIEPFIVSQKPGPSARGRCEYLQPLQMRHHSCVALPRTAYKYILDAGFSDFVDCNGNSPLVIEPSDSIDNINWSLEEKDDKDCDEIIFQFIALSRYDTVGSVMETKSVFFTFQFNRFPQISTERLKLDNIVDNISNYVTSTPMILRPLNKDGSPVSDAPGSLVRYLINPENMNMRERYSFLEYMNQQALNIDVWDGDSLMLLGSCAVPLKGMCRQGNTSVQMMYELDIINQAEIEEGNISSIKGRIHLRMINLGTISPVKVRKMAFAAYMKKDFVIDATDMNCFNGRSQLGGSLRNVSKTGNQLRQSVVVVRPQTAVAKHRELAELLLSRTSQGDSGSIKSSKTPLMNEDILRGISHEKSKKLSRLKSLMETLQNDMGNSVETKHNANVDKVAELDVIQHFREQQKKTTIRRILSSVVEKEIVIYPKFGCTEIFEVKIKNHFNHESNIQIEIIDESTCLALVLNPHELRALKSLYSITTSSEDDLITTNKQNGCPEIFMRPKESVLVPFKYSNNTFDGNPIIPEPSFRASSVKQLHCLPRTGIEREILFRTSDGTLLTMIRVIIYPQLSTINQTFRFFHPEQSYLKKIIRLPPLYVIAGPYDTIKALTKCSDLTVAIDCQQVPVGSPHDVFIRVNCGPFPEIRQFLLAVYADRFMLRPIQVWQFTIHSQKRMDVVAYQGQTSHHPLLVQAPSDRHLIKVFSSLPNELSVGTMDKNVGKLSLSLTPRSIGNRMFTVNVVDSDTWKLVTAWSICAICKDPIVSKTFQLQIPAKGGDECKKKVSYTNPYGQEKQFFIITDRQDLVMFKNTILEIGPNKMEYIGIIFMPVRSQREEKIFVFINNEEGKNEETFSILINYV